jgi:hypothetical protein
MSLIKRYRDSLLAYKGVRMNMKIDHCQLCYRPSDRFGTLVDPNKHTWRICADCINSLWADRQAINQDEPDKSLADQVAAKVIERLGLNHAE